MRLVSVGSGGSAPAPRGGHSLSTVGERVYLFGGCAFPQATAASASAASSSSSLVYMDNDVFCFDLHTLRWSVACAASPAAPGRAPARRYAHAAAAVGASVLVFGGYNARDGYLGDLWVFDTVGRAWRELSPRGTAPPARYAHSAVAVGATVYVFGGCAELACFRDLWALDTAALTWTRLASRGTTPSPRAYHTAVVVGGGSTMLVFGGRAGSTYFNDMYAFDIASATWSRVEQRGSVPSEVAYHTAVEIGGRMIVVGGMDGKALFGAVSAFDPLAQTWERADPAAELGSASTSTTQQLSPSVLARHKHAAAVFGSCMLVVGGMGFSPIVFGDAFVLDFSSPYSSQAISPQPHSSFSQQQQFQAAAAPAAAVVKHEASSSSSSPPSNPLLMLDPSRPMLPPPTPVVVPQTTAAAAAPPAPPLPTQPPAHHPNAELRAELARCYRDLDLMSGKALDGVSFTEIEALELASIDALKAFVAAKRAAVEAEVQRRLAQQEAEHAQQLEDMQRRYTDARTGPTMMTAASVPQMQAKIEELQGMLTAEQNKNLRLRRRLRAAGIDPDESALPRRRANRGAGAAIGVGWGTVETREYVPAQSRDSVPSCGVAPLGLSDRCLGTHRERLEGFERRREAERKGVSRVPEEQRREMLSRVGVDDSAIDEEGDRLAEVNWGRIESLASPTDNPLPEEQRQAYKRFVDSA